MSHMVINTHKIKIGDSFYAKFITKDFLYFKQENCSDSLITWYSFYHRKESFRLYWDSTHGIWNFEIIKFEINHTVEMEEAFYGNERKQVQKISNNNLICYKKY